MDWRCLTLDPWPLTKLQKCVHRKDKQIRYVSLETLEITDSNHTLLCQHILIRNCPLSNCLWQQKAHSPWILPFLSFQRVSVTWKSFFSKQNWSLCKFGPCFPFCLLASQGIKKRIWGWLRQTDQSSLYSKYPLGPITISIVYLSPVAPVGRGRLWETHCLNSEINLSWVGHSGHP